MRSLVLMAPLERVSMRRVEKPLPLLQSRLIVVAHLTILIGITLVCFGVGQALSCGKIRPTDVAETRTRGGLHCNRGGGSRESGGRPPVRRLGWIARTAKSGCGMPRRMGVPLVPLDDTDRVPS